MARAKPVAKMERMSRKLMSSMTYGANTDYRLIAVRGRKSHHFDRKIQLGGKLVTRSCVSSPARDHPPDHSDQRAERLHRPDEPAHAVPDPEPDPGGSFEHGEIQS